MSRSKTDMINDDNYYIFMQDIWNDAAWELITALRDIYVADFIPVREPNYLAYNLMSISFFFNSENQNALEPPRLKFSCSLPFFIVGIVLISTALA